MNQIITKRCSPIEEAIYQDGFQAGAASRDADVQRLQMALADTEALELGTAEKCDQLREQVALLRGVLKNGRRAYVNLMENGRDRIIYLGGDCDSLDVMERGDPFIKECNEALAATEPKKG